MLVYTRFFEILAFLAFWALLGAAIFMMLAFYVCDGQSCKPYVTAETVAPPGTQEYVLTVLNEFATDGVWPIPYIGAAILTPLCLWFLKIPITILNFGVLFFVSFVIIYFMFSFYNHHYVKMISQYTSNYIRSNCPGSTATIASLDVNEEPICNQEDEDDPGISDPKILDNGLGITFAPPVNVF